MYTGVAHKMHAGCNAKYPLFVLHFSLNWYVHTNFSNTH